MVGVRGSTGRGGAEPAPYREDRMSQQTGRRVVGPYGSITGGAKRRADVGGNRGVLSPVGEEAQRLLARVLASSIAFRRAPSPS